jgi:hypothetical protein
MGVSLYLTVVQGVLSGGFPAEGWGAAPMAPAGSTRDAVGVDQEVRFMRLVGSACLIVAGLILILWVNGSVRGVEANTIGGALLLLGFVTALVTVALGARRAQEAPPRDEREPIALSRR